MRGVLLCVFRVVRVFVFSLILFLRDNLLMFWLFLELSALRLIPSFFLYLRGGILLRLFNYVIVSGVSSSLIICGLLFEDLLILSIVGLLLKFGIFPLLGWVYVVVVSSNWLVVWGLSTVLKSPFLFFGFFLRAGYGSFFIEVCCILTFLFVGLLFWFYTYD